MLNAMTQPLLQAINALQLPIDPSCETKALVAFRNLASGKSLSEDDAVVLLAEATDDWAVSDKANPFLVQTIKLLLAASSNNVPLDGGTYLKLYKTLRKGGNFWIGLSHTLTRRLLSRTKLIAYLLSTERFSCTQVARILYATEASLDVPHQAVAVIAKSIGHLPELDEKSIKTLWEIDQSRSLALFPDSDVSDSCATAALEAAKWVPEVNLENILFALIGPRENPIFWPYLQVLHWCCIPIEYFDHPTSYLYEFHPRGALGQALFLRYRERLQVATNNPILNNMKAVQTLNTTWAHNRGGDDAQALVAIVGLMESLPFGARRQVGQVIRAWLHRMIELHSVQLEPIESSINIQHIDKVVDFVVKQESKTQGVIEQRVVDCLSLLAFGKQGKAKGIGDSINASNFSKHKLGDVEFANLDNRQAIALEAHGGHLSAVYVEDHLRSLSRIIEQRLAESWRSFDEPDKWSIKVLFVAHSFDSKELLPKKETVHGVKVDYKYWHYDTLKRLAYKRINDASCIGQVFSQYLIDELNKPTVRQEVRRTFNDIIK